MIENRKIYQFETPFDHIQDINELVLAARAQLAGKDERSPDELSYDVMDFASALIANWIILREPVPVDTKERFGQIIERVIICLQKLLSYAPDDPETFKKELRHLLRCQLISRENSSN
jgi:hypothetical protein